MCVVCFPPFHRTLRIQPRACHTLRQIRHNFPSGARICTTSSFFSKACSMIYLVHGHKPAYLSPLPDDTNGDFDADDVLHILHVFFLCKRLIAMNAPVEDRYTKSSLVWAVRAVEPSPSLLEDCESAICLSRESTYHNNKVYQCHITRTTEPQNQAFRLPSVNRA